MLVRITAIVRILMFTPGNIWSVRRENVSTLCILMSQAFKKIEMGVKTPISDLASLSLYHPQGMDEQAVFIPTAFIIFLVIAAAMIVLTTATTVVVIVLFAIVAIVV